MYIFKLKIEIVLKIFIDLGIYVKRKYKNIDSEISEVNINLFKLQYYYGTIFFSIAVVTCSCIVTINYIN